MDAIDRLIAIEEIRQLLSRRARLIDGKHWDQLVDIYTDDMPSRHTGMVGGRAQVEFVAKALEGVRSIHQIHLPEIEITGPTTAKAIVPMEDLLVWEDEDGTARWAHGFGHYRQSFIRTERGWLICDHELVRQYIREGFGPFDPSTGAAQPTSRFMRPIEYPPARF